MNARDNAIFYAGFGLKRALAFITTLFAVGGCFSSSLMKPPDWNAVVRPQPAVVALDEISDTVPCDDEAYYLQEYIEDRNLFYDIVLADPDNPKDYHDADVVISGTVTAEIGRPKTKGLGVFVNIISCGMYCFLGGPVKHQETTVDYTFQVFYSDLNMTKTYIFSDSRKASYGLYKPTAKMERKPGLYQAGWDALLYEVCRELTGQSAQTGAESVKVR